MKSYTRGFTLVEVIIYIAVAAVLLALVMTFYGALQSARIKEQAINEVETQGAVAMTLMTQTVRNAKLITAPATSTSASSLSLTTYLSSTTPTVFDLSSSALRIKEGVGTVIALTNSQVVVSNLSFQNLSWTSTSGSIKIQFTIDYASTTKQSNTIYGKTFYGSATIRRLQQ
ncbi:MAG TPA: prepilin-type N-terminal cleavage/methylation domain-containing protein [Candidatus Paceibacterota bacterium]|jgi:prepilin-type N-terminal cleavage/methylation domain-containing protein|nr:prepilin-type N-terminal cleavage/methylation domain-containing protein [Candidatus Paceibacterota bacterium]